MKFWVLTSWNILLFVDIKSFWNNLFAIVLRSIIMGQFVQHCKTVLYCQIKKFFIQELDVDWSVCMATTCYSKLIYTIYLEIIALLSKIIHAKFREDILSNKKVLLPRLNLIGQFVWQLFAIVDRSIQFILGL